MRQLDPDSFFEISQASINSSLASVIEKKSNSSDALKMVHIYYLYYNSVV